LDRIDMNVYNSVANTNSAQKWLLKYKASISSNRGMILKLFIVLVIIIVVFMVMYK